MPPLLLLLLLLLSGKHNEGFVSKCKKVMHAENMQFEHAGMPEKAEMLTCCASIVVVIVVVVYHTK